jgi:peptidoglycan/xylan/chitin deacetylase (PgdA/CDA1 family)
MNRPGARTRREGLRVLTYHGFGLGRAPTLVDPSIFAETLATFAEEGFRCADLRDWVARGCPDEPLGYALAFDDGLSSILHVVDTMTRFGATATVFVVTDRVGADNAWPGQPTWVPRERLLDWSELSDLSRRGCRIGAHGASHQRLDQLTSELGSLELRSARASVEDRIGQPCRLLAYPYGMSSPALRVAAARHYSAAFGTRLDVANVHQDHFDLARLDSHYFRSQAARESLLTEDVHARLRWRRSIRAVRQWGSEVLRQSASDRGINA